MNQYDVVIIGGGINGCGIASDASQRNLSVLLCEKNDLASGTSSASTKLIHGGLRYLEYGHFHMVKKALDERQTLLRTAPNLIRPIKLVLPINNKIRSRWLTRIGLFLYDHLSFKNTLDKTRYYNQINCPELSPLKSIKQAYSFYDCATDDSRLTITNAIQAQQFGATIKTQTECVAVNYLEDGAIITLQDKSKHQWQVKTRAIINATGPWVKQVDDILQLKSPYPIKLVQGTHIVIKQLFNGNHGYLIQNDDKRILFAIPYHGHTLIGTTELELKDSPDYAQVQREEVEYLINSTNQCFNSSISAKDIIEQWCGVRPLIGSDNQSLKSLNRDYKIHKHDKNIPVLSIYGGKITTFRQLANNAVDLLSPYFTDLSACTTASTPLPKGKIHYQSLTELTGVIKSKYPWLDKELCQRLCQNYGVLVDKILTGCSQLSHLGEHFGHNLYAQEVDYLIEHEWAQEIDDILSRRTKLGLNFSKQQQKNLEMYLNNRYKMKKIAK